MIKGKRKIKLTPETILDKISEYDIFRYYMPDHSWKLNQVTYSPFRKENNPSFVIGTLKAFKFEKWEQLNRDGSKTIKVESFSRWWTRKGKEFMTHPKSPNSLADRIKLADTDKNYVKPIPKM